MKYRFLVLLLSAPLPAQGGAEAAIRQAELRRIAAMTRADTSALRPMLGDELSYIHSNARVETKEDHLAAIGSRRIVYQAVTPVALSYRVLGEFAIGSGTVSAKGSLEGAAFDIVVRVTTVHVRRNGQWQLLAWQSTRIP